MFYLVCLEISSVKVNSHVANSVHCEPLADLTINKPDEFNGYPELMRKLCSDLFESDEGGPSISIPSQVSIAAPLRRHSSYTCNC